LLATDEGEAVADLLDALFLPLVVYLAVGDYGYASTPSPDVPLYGLGFVAGSELFRLLLRYARHEVPLQRGAPRADAHALAAIVLLAVVGVTNKTSFIGMGAALVVSAFAVYFALVRTSGPGAQHAWWGMAAAMLFVGGMWVARGVILSGYLIYPSPLLSLPVDWRVPLERVQWYTMSVRAESRTNALPHDVASQTWQWLSIWLNYNTKPPFDFELIAPLLLVFAGGPLLWLVTRRELARRGLSALPWAFLAMPAMAFLFWLIVAPQPRFGNALFWLAAGAVIANACRLMDRHGVRVVAIVLVVALFGLGVNVIRFVLEWHRDAGPVRHAVVEVRTTDSGLPVYTPVGDARVWDAPLPCTPYFNPKLRLRVAGDVARGFVEER
jgi:hypothetical protein